MRFTLEFIHLAAIAVWMGSLVFFSFVTAPSLFRTLPPEAAGDAVSGIFPLYSHLGVLCGAVGALSALGLARIDERSGNRRRLSAMMLALMIVLTLYASEVVAPRAADLRARMHAPGLDETERAGRRAAFAAVHRRSVGANGVVLLLGTALLVLRARELSTDRGAAGAA
jgi:putative copper export protein